MSRSRNDTRARLKAVRLLTLTLILMPFMFGCTFTAQQVHFEPKIRQVEATSPAPAATTFPLVSLVTSDERTSSAIGNRGLGVGMSAEIRTNDDIASLIRGQVSSALAAEDSSSALLHQTMPPVFVVQFSESYAKHLNVALSKAL